MPVKLLSKVLVVPFLVVLNVALLQTTGAVPPAGATQLNSTALQSIANAISPSVQLHQVTLASGGVSPDSPMTLSVTLKRSDPSGFARYVSGVSNPGSSTFRHYLTPINVADRFGPSSGVYQAVSGFFMSHGFEIVRQLSSRLSLIVRAPVQTVESALDLNIASFKLGQRRVYANTNDPSLPKNIASDVASIGGLSDIAAPAAPSPAVAPAPPNTPCQKNLKPNLSACFPNPTPGTLSDKCWEVLKQLPSAIASSSVELEDKALYECAADQLNLVAKYAGSAGAASLAADVKETKASTLAATTPTGTGQKIGLVEFGSFNESDVSDYLSAWGYSSNLINNVSVVQPFGSPGSPQPASEQEILLDIDSILTLAPGAQIVVYEAPQSTTFDAMFNYMVSDKDTVISNSWASCENEESSSELNALDTSLQGAVASGVTVLNATGDSGSTCLDGAADTVSVPADDPNATAVGGSSGSPGPGGTYGTETWWNGAQNVPPTGQGGFGVSTFFARPSYQASFTTASARSVPDVVANADPVEGYNICEADNGGCPNGLLYGGTSVAAPTWAAFVADLNQATGQDLGFLNPILYQNSAEFHSGASMSPATDFAHVGIGSPNLDSLALAIEKTTAGPVDAGLSSLSAVSCSTGQSVECPLATISADGSSQDTLLVTLVDANGNTIGGKSVSIGASSTTTQAGLDSTGGTTSANNGSVVFTATDTVPETVTYTAVDTTDGVSLAPLTVTFVSPPATAGGISPSTQSVPADGISTATITVTLQNAAGQGAEGKTVTLQAGGNAAFSPSEVTNSSGVATFEATDETAETVTFTATDVTDGSLPVPGSAQVTFTKPGSPPSNAACFTGTPTATSGYAFSSVLTGLAVTNLISDGYNCPGVDDVAFDSAGDLYVLDYTYNGSSQNLYEIRAGGGSVKTIPLPNRNCDSNPCGDFLGIAFGQDGNLYATRQGDQFSDIDGGVVQLDPTTGAIMRTVASDPSSGILNCASGMAVDPISGDLFVTTANCGNNNTFGQPNVVRIANPDSATPQASLYAQTCTPTCSVSVGVAFGPDGTLYVTTDDGIDTVTGTNGPSTPVVTNVASFTAQEQKLGGFPALLLNPADPSEVSAVVVNSGVGIITEIDLASKQDTTIYSGGSTGEGATVGPDGCLYATQSDRVIRVTNSDGTCNFAPTAVPQLKLSPNTATNTQGNTQTLTAQLLNVASAAGTLVQFQVSGPDQQTGYAVANALGVATFSYEGRFASSTFQGGLFTGADKIVATAAVSGSTLSSDPATITWASGVDETAVAVSPSPRNGAGGSTVNFSVSLADISQIPYTAISGQSIAVSVDGATCTALTNSSGSGTCGMTLPTSPGAYSVDAQFAGSGQYGSSSTVEPFVVVSTTPTLTSIAVTPANPSITKGTTQQFTATGTYSDNSTANITSQVSWTSGTTSVATITSSGLATGVAAGSSTITATLGSVSGNTKSRGERTDPHFDCGDAGQSLDHQGDDTAVHRHGYLLGQLDGQHHLPGELDERDHLGGHHHHRWSRPAAWGPGPRPLRPPSDRSAGTPSSR